MNEAMERSLEKKRFLIVQGYVSRSPSRARSLCLLAFSPDVYYSVLNVVMSCSSLSLLIFFLSLPLLACLLRVRH